MQRIQTSELGRHVGQTVQLSGWLHRLRRLRHVGFLLLRDSRGIAQIVLEDPQQIEETDRLHPESVLSVKGPVVSNPQASGGVEIHDPEITVIPPAAPPPPLEMFRPTLREHLP